MTAINPNDVAVAMMQRAHDLGIVHFSPTGSAPTNLSIPLAVLGLLPDPPLRAAAFNVYNVVAETDDDLQAANPLIYIQVRFREPGDDGGLAVGNRAHAFFEAMHSQTPGPWPGGVAPAWCLRTVTAPADLDNGHWSKADSYEIRYNPGE